MPETVRDTREGEFQLRDAEVMRKDLGFQDVKELSSWLDGPRFGQFFKEYAKEWIYPQQQQIRSLGSARPRGPNLATVEERLIAGERPGYDKYSFTQPDKSDWDHVDYLAKLLFDIRRANTKSVQGVFFKKKFTEAEINHRIWVLIKQQEYACAPSRRKGKDSTKASTKPAPESSSKPAAVVPTQLQLPLPGDPAPPPPPADDDHPPPPADDDHSPPPIDDDPPQDLLDHSEDALPLTNAQKMAKECDVETMDLEYRFWQAALIDKVVKHTSEPATFWEAIDVAKHLDTVMDRHEAIGWFREVIESLDEDTIAYAPFTDQTAVEFDRQQQFFDNVAYQREDTEEACNLLNIPWHGPEDTIMRMPGMALSVQFTFWQPVAIKFIIDAIHNDNLRGCVIADVMGLGKTWVTIGLLLWWVNSREQGKSRKMEMVPPKPHLILVPRQLITQWIEAFDLVAPGVFYVYKYYGDTRKDKNRGDKKVHGLLHKGHELFDRQEHRARTVIISSYQTWQERHGPKALRSWRTTKKRFSVTEATTHYDELDETWEGALVGCFDFVITDEAQMLKNLSAKGSVAVSWLAAYHYIMLTATPIPNGVQDWAGYMPFIEPKDADKLWEEESLKALGFEEDQDPFALHDEHPAAKLQFTTRAFKDWIAHRRIEPIRQGAYLERIWRKSILRRTMSSSIPFDHGRLVRDALPRLHCALINCEHESSEKERYKATEVELTGGLVIGKKWNLSQHRKLSLLTTSLDLPNLDERLNFKAVAIKKHLEKAEFYLDWDTDMDLKHGREMLLFKLCNGAPKIRALLRNVRDQVIRNQEKAIVWCQLPAVSLYLYAIFKLIGIKVVVITAHQTSEERDKYKDLFNHSEEEAMVLIIPFAVGATGLNLQERCHRVHIVESAHNDSTLAQAIGRTRRLGNPSDVVYVYQYYVGGTFDDIMVRRNIEKAIPEAMAELNRQIFKGGDEDTQASVDIGDWCLINGCLVTMEEAKDTMVENEEDPIPLSAHDVLTHILMGMKGQQIMV